MATQADIERDSGQGLIDNVLEGVEYVAVGIEVLAVVIIVVSIATATLTYVMLRFQRQFLLQDLQHLLQFRLLCRLLDLQ